MSVPAVMAVSARRVGLGVIGLAALAGLAGLLAAGCREAVVQRLGIDTASPVSVAFVVHGAEGDPFWAEVRQGAEDAARAFAVDVSWRSDVAGEARQQLIEEAVRQGFDTLVITLSDPDAVSDVARAAVVAGRTLYVINAGSSAALELGADSYFGQVETVAGLAAGDRLSAAGAGKLLCVVHEQGNLALATRCERSGFRVGAVEVLPVELDASAAELEAVIGAALDGDAAIDAVLTMNALLLEPALAAVERRRSAEREIVYAVFEIDDATLDAIEVGRVLFAVDQQAYLQGYLPVAYARLTQYSERTQGDELADALLQWIAGGGVFLGPGFVDATNVQRVREARR